MPALSLGLFAATAGHADTQSPHDQDEVYVVVAGEAVLNVDGVGTKMSAGSVAYVPAHMPHRFVDISADLRVMVVFVPPYTDATRASLRSQLSQSRIAASTRSPR